MLIAKARSSCGSSRSDWRLRGTSTKVYRENIGGAPCDTAANASALAKEFMTCSSDWHKSVLIRRVTMSDVLPNKQMGFYVPSTMAGGASRASEATPPGLDRHCRLLR